MKKKYKSRQKAEYWCQKI